MMFVLDGMMLDGMLLEGWLRDGLCGYEYEVKQVRKRLVVKKALGVLLKSSASFLLCLYSSMCSMRQSI